VASNPPSEYTRNRHRYPAVTVDIIIFALVEDDLNVLLVRRRYAPFAGMWAIPGGFLEIGESLEEAAIRELEEETGVTGVYMEQLYTFGDPERDPRMRVITVAYFALVSIDAVQHRPGDDASETRWFSIFQLPQLAFDHRRILEYALTRLRNKLEYSAVGLQLLPDYFTLTELQNAYEVVLGHQLDKRNFRRKVLASGILEETGRRKKSTEGRPAMLYLYRRNAVTEFKKRRLFP